MRNLSLATALLATALVPTAFTGVASAQYPPRVAAREARAYDRGYQEGYRNGFDLHGGSGAPGWMTDRMFKDDKREFRRGYKEGFNRGKWERKHGSPRRF